MMREKKQCAEASREPENAAPSPARLVREDLRRGRGARSNRAGRFEREHREEFDDGWEGLAALEPLQREVYLETAKSIISRNDSPDLSFDRSINPYRGCEHGCIYCYARPTHCYLGHSAGLDFEAKLYAKTNAAELLEQELAHPRYEPRTIALGAVTDPYQPIEREYKITRADTRSARAMQSPRRYHHEVGAHRSRYRYSREHG